MKSIMTRSSASLVIALAMAVGMFLLSSSASRTAVGAQETIQDAKSQSNGGKLEGTWRVQVIQRNCQTGAELRTFPAMLTFAQGGTLTGTTTAFPVALRSPDHGVWNYNGHRSYRAVSEAFVFSPAGAWVSTQRITQAIQVGPGQDNFTSDATVEFFDTLGNTMSTGCATAVATRME